MLLRFHNECPTYRDVLQNFPIFFFLTRESAYQKDRKSMIMKLNYLFVVMKFEASEILDKCDDC